MNELDFRRLAAAAGELMELPDPEGFGHGEPTDISGVIAEIYLDNDMPSRAILVLEMGQVKAEHKAEAYEVLLAVQGMLYPTHDCVFDHDGIDDMVLLRCALPLFSDSTAHDLAIVIEICVQQVRTWRETLMSGWLIGPEIGVIKPSSATPDTASIFFA